MARPDDANQASRGLRRRSIEGQGEVWSGPVADEALAAVDARAMTMDRTIIVADDFDPNDAEDQALYAHEAHHQRHSGGEGAPDEGHDAEEKAAQAVEAMVLHRRAAGDDFREILHEIEAGSPAAEDAHDRAGPPDATAERGHDPMLAYRALRAKGWSHESIVRQLTQHVLREVAEGERDRAMRAPLGGRTL